MNIIEDKRPIEAIWLEDGEDGWTTDPESSWQRKCDRIEAYHENGEMAAVIWFKIYKDGQIIHRINGRMVEDIVYELKKDDE